MIRVTDKQFWMDGILKSNLDSLIYNLKRDFDALVLITGSGMVRVGKTMIAQQIGYYAAHKLNTPFDIDNILFTGADLMHYAKQKPLNSVLIYDEARHELNNKMLMDTISKTLMDFFSECGMYNHLLIVIMPDFFEIPKSIALNRSECLINVIRTSSDAVDNEGNAVVKFERGVFEFYGRRTKKLLYIMGKKDFDNYDVGKKLRNFYGDFPNHWIIDKKAYDLKKNAHVARDRGAGRQDLRTALLFKLLLQHYSQRELADKMTALGFPITQARISQFINISKENDFKINDKRIDILTQPGETNASKRDSNIDTIYSKFGPNPHINIHS